MSKKDKRITIYDLAKELNIAPSSVSKALNNSHAISSKIKELVEAKAKELNYKHNTNAANLRRGSSKTIGVIVPRINQTFFSNVIAGIEEVCASQQHSLIICQSYDSYEKEVLAVETLIRQNVDCILISLSLETKLNFHLKEIQKNHIHLIQFDRVDFNLKSHTIENDNLDSAYQAVMHLVGQGYKNIAFLGGPAHLPIYAVRKEGYIKAIKAAGLNLNKDFIVDDAITKEQGKLVSAKFLEMQQPPDAFFCVSDYAALGILDNLKASNLRSPEQIGIVGFANENFTELITPALSSIDQKSFQIGIEAANLYFNYILKTTSSRSYRNIEVKSEIIIRDSSIRL